MALSGMTEGTILPVLPINSGVRVTRQLRRRVNVAISVKGIISWDCTIEGNEGYTEAELLAESDSLVAQLKQRYPINEGGGKE